MHHLVDDTSRRKALAMLIVLVAVTSCVTTATVEALYIVAWLFDMVASLTWRVALALAVMANGMVLLASWIAVRVLRGCADMSETSSEPELVDDTGRRRIASCNPALEVLARRFLPIVLAVRPFSRRSAR
jgi:hypothetical protein